MKSALTVVLFRLFTIGVFADGKETSNVESVSLMEGDSVTLKSGVTDMQTVDEIEWRFNGIRIEKFVDRLQLDKQTGDLKISNISTTDSGQYKVKISSTDGSSEITFTVKVVPADAAKSISVLMGDSVTLSTSLTDIQRYEIQWKFKHENPPVAEISRKTGNVSTSYSPDGRFRDILQLNHQTGSLTIRNTRTTHSGVYEVEITSTSSRYTIHKSFSVIVNDAVKSVSVKEGNSATLQIDVTKIQKNDHILWMFGDIGLAETYEAELQFYNGTDGRFRDRLQLDHQTGSLTITNTRTTDSGDYQLKISSSRYTINRRITVNVSAVPGSGLSPAAVAGIVVGGVVLQLLLV